MTAKTAAILAPIQEELGDLLDALEHSGAAYARAYLEHLVEGTVRPRRPADLNAGVAKVVRDIVLDRAVYERLLVA